MRKDFYTANISQLDAFLDLSSKPDLSLSIKESTLPQTYYPLPDNSVLFTNIHTSLGHHRVEPVEIPPLLLAALKQRFSAI